MKLKRAGPALTSGWKVTETQIKKPVLGKPGPAFLFDRGDDLLKI